jgi:hypothetical protein
VEDWAAEAKDWEEGMALVGVEVGVEAAKVAEEEGRRQKSAALPRHQRPQPSHRWKPHLNVTKPDINITQRELSASPSELLASPSELSSSPSELSASPSELLASPSELLASPSELRASPSELLASPSELSASPSELLASPSELVAPPSELTVGAGGHSAQRRRGGGCGVEHRVQHATHTIHAVSGCACPRELHAAAASAAVARGGWEQLPQVQQSGGTCNTIHQGFLLRFQQGPNNSTGIS